MRNIIRLSIFLVSMLFLLSCKNKNPAENQKPVIKHVNPEKGPIELMVSSTGRVISNLDVEIKCKASGEIISLPFDISDQVKKGELVVELDPVDEQRNVDKAKVSLTSSLAVLEKAKTNIQIAETDLKSAKKKAQINLEASEIKAKDARAKADRIKQLYEQKLSGYEEYETALTVAARADADLENAKITIEELKTDEESLELKRQDLKLAQADYESTRINLSQAEQRLKDTKVYSPIDGIVTVRTVQTGQIISSGISNVGGGTSIMTISDLTRIFVLASVDESDIGNVREGHTVTITADAYSEAIFDGVVERIAPQGENKSNVVTFEVRIEVLSKNKNLLKPEMTTNVDIIMAQKDSVLHIPYDALSRVKGKYFVTVVEKDGSEAQREVQIGVNNGEIVEIISGLTETDTVVVKERARESEWRPGGAARVVRMGGGGRR